MILMRKRELVALRSLSSWCLVIVVWLFLAAPWVCLQFVIVVFPDHLLFSAITEDNVFLVRAIDIRHISTLWTISSLTSIQNENG